MACPCLQTAQVPHQPHRLAEVTGREVDQIREDARRGRTLTTAQAIGYGLIQSQETARPVPGARQVSAAVGRVRPAWPVLPGLARVKPGLVSP